MKRIFPASKNGRCIKGFCPTICDDDAVIRVFLDLSQSLFKYGIKYHHIVVVDC